MNLENTEICTGIENNLLPEESYSGEAAIENYGLVSIIVPVYNIEDYLTPCIESILNQTYPFFELLLVDDGSSDHSPEICDNFALLDSRVKVIHKKNQGPSATRNRGIEESQGDFVVFVDSDDLIKPQMLEKMVRAITRYETDLVICGYERFRENWHQFFRLSPYSMVILQSKLELASVYNKPNTNMFGISIWAKMYRAQIIKQHHVRFKENINYEEDCIFNLDYFQHVNTTAVLRDYFYSYRQMDSSLSKGYRKNSFQFLVNGYRERKRFLTELGMSTTGADNILVIVIKNSFIKVYNSTLSQAEKYEEYRAIMSFDETREVCTKATSSRSRLTRLLADAVIKNDVKKVHTTLRMWETVDKAKNLIKKVLRKVRRR